MKYKKYVILGVCIALIGSFIGFNQYTNKNKDNNISTAATSDTNKNKTNAEVNNTGISDGTKEAASTPASTETSNKDITLVDTTPNTEGNSSSNLASGGYFAKQGKWIYFTIPPVNSKLHPIYRSMSDGETGLKALTNEGNFRCINVIGEWVYYISGDNTPYIYRTKTDGSLTELVLENPAYYMFIKDGYIYYDSSNGISKLKLNSLKGDNGTPIAKASNYSYFYIFHDLIYVLVGGMNVIDPISGRSEWISNLYTMNLNGSNFKKLSNDNLSTYTFYNDYIFYFNIEKQKYYRMNLNGSNKIQLFSSPINSFTIYNNNIYFTGYGENQNNIYKSDLNGKGIVKITNNSSNLNSASINYINPLSIIDDNIFYLATTSYNYNLYRTNTDGSITRLIY